MGGDWDWASPPVPPSCRGYTIAYAAAGSATKRARTERRMIVERMVGH